MTRLFRTVRSPVARIAVALGSWVPLVTLASCAHTSLSPRQQGSADLDCPDDQVTVERGWTAITSTRMQESYRVSGCGQQVTYEARCEEGRLPRCGPLQKTAGPEPVPDDQAPVPSE